MLYCVLRNYVVILDQDGYWAVLLGIFLEDFGVPVPGETLLIAGTGRMRWPRFLLFNALGAAIWVCFWVGITYYLGDRLVIIFTRFKMFEVWLLAALAAVVLLYIMYRLIGRHRRDRSF